MCTGLFIFLLMVFPWFCNAACIYAVNSLMCFLIQLIQIFELGGRCEENSTV
ncbi:hypothetical protein K661_00681 [Piscirickettsia salmonis LF-89 = ATCC VR-1361]|nr:hypothetical protein K661_00681 [Piscirickettsia salmonis LF-89 = ATCC VR-1361]